MHQFPVFLSVIYFCFWLWVNFIGEKIIMQSISFLKNIVPMNQKEMQEIVLIVQSIKIISKKKSKTFWRDLDEKTL